MKNQFSDINQQIDRILSCNIRQELLSGLPMELLQSPVVQKKLPKYSVQSSNKRSEKMSQIEQDLYEKAEQVFKLKQLLQTELANINQIVADNQKLTEANDYLKQELKKVKNEWEQLKVQTVDKLQKEIQLLKEFQAEQIEKITQETNKNKNQRKNKMLVSSCDQIIEMSVKMSRNQLFQQEKLQIHSHFVNLFIQPSKINTHSNMTSKYVQTSYTFETFETLESLQAEMTNLNTMIESLKTDKTFLNNKISTLQSIQTIKNSGHQNQPEVLTQKHLNHQQKSQQKSSIQCYSSIFMKSVFQQDENIEENIRKALYNSQQSIFQQLQESKYFGKIIMKTKNGNAIQQYKNMFQYEGKFFKNQRQGLGKLFYKNQLVYAGEWKNGKFEGKGTLYYYLNLNVQKIQANFEKGMIQGFGTIYFKSKSKIRAKFRKNIISSEERILAQEEIQQNLRHKSLNGKAQFNRDKENTCGKGRVFFQIESGKLITIN